MSYFQKYLKYKSKYLTLKQQLEGQMGGAEENKEPIELNTLSDSPSTEEIEKKITPEEDEEKEEQDEMNTSEYSASETEQEQDGGAEEGTEEGTEEGAEEKDDEEKDGAEEKEEVETETDSETDSDLSDSESEDEQTGGAFFNHVMDQLSSSVKSFDLQKGNFDSELSSLSEFSI